MFNNFKLVLRFLIFSVVGTGLFGCSHGQCKGSAFERVSVSKADGSLQCEKKTGLSVKDMAKELEGIEIFSMENKSDGKMHMTVCGSPTGMINVYQIKRNDLEKAKALGFTEVP